MACAKPGYHSERYLTQGCVQEHQLTPAQFFHPA